MITQIQNLVLAGSKAMNVDGSNAAKTFTYTASQASALLGITCILKDEGTTSFNKFGAITALTNGILLQSTIGGNNTSLSTIKDNSDLCTRFHFNQFGNGSVLSLLGVSTPQGFGGTNNAFIGYLEFPMTNFFILDSDDSIQAIVQDNLTGIDILEMAVKIGVSS